MSLADHVGCLAHLATRAEDATWEESRWSQDDDYVYLEVVDPYYSDQMKLLGSKALASESDKTQVFVGRSNPYTRPRSRHTYEVMQAAIPIASATGLNVVLSVAGGLGHDIGHLPFGHHGEIALGEILGVKVNHAAVGVLIARCVERKGRGLNLTKQTLQIILHHSSGAGDVVSTAGIPEEAAAVMWADKFAYTFADVNDFRRCLEDSEPELVNEIAMRALKFGLNQRERTLRCVTGLVAESDRERRISFSKSECAQQFAEFRKWLFDNAYFPTQGGRSVIIEGLKRVYDLLDTCTEFGECDTALLLALLTDREAWHLIELAQDSRRLSIKQIPHFGITEIYKHLRGVKFDLSDPWA